METITRQRVCTNCQIEKSLEAFYKDKKASLGRTAKCRDCILAARKLYYQENREARIAYSKDRYESNREAELERRKAYRQKNWEAKAAADRKYRELNREYYLQYLRQYQKSYYSENKHKRNAKEAKRRSAKLQATPLWADLSKIEGVYKECEAMSSGLDRAAFHVDHIDPLLSSLVCGLHILENLQIITATENCIKQNRFTPYGVDANGDRYDLPIDKAKLRAMVKAFKSEGDRQ